MTVEHYDLIIVGTGSGNSIPNEELANKKIAIVERGTFGGTCINVGCIPTKMFVYTADRALEAQDSSHLSLDTQLNNVDWKDIQRRVFETRIDPIAAAGEEYRRGEDTPNITFYSGTASFTGERELSISLNNTTAEGSSFARITGDAIILATGTRPFIPEIITTSGVAYRTNEDIMRLPELPRSLTILGGGIIAAEFAHVFSALGTRVTVINRSAPMLRTLDATIVERFHKQAAQRWDMKLERTLTEISTHTDGRIAITLDDGTQVISDELLVALGRVSNADLLNLPATGVSTDARSHILVDEYGRTSAPGIWALGDASNTFQLKHVANSEARVIQHNLAHPEAMKKNNHRYVPSGIFTHPQIATVGMTEAEAKVYGERTGHTISIKIQEFSDVAYGWAMEETESFCKLIADADTGKLLGAHIMGSQATTLIQILISAMVFDIDLRTFAHNQYWPHPALSEVVENALLGLQFTAPEPKNLQP